AEGPLALALVLPAVGHKQPALAGRRIHAGEEVRRAANRRDRIARIVAKGRGRLVLRRRLGAELVAIVQIVVRVPRAGERPLVLIAPRAAVPQLARFALAPIAATHHEETDGGTGRGKGGILQRPIEPIELQLEVLLLGQRGGGAKVDAAEVVVPAE